MKPPITKSAPRTEFMPNKALDYARVLARPRRAGSGEDEIVAQEIAQRLEQFGWVVERQPFRFSNLVNVAIAAELLVGLLLIALAPAWVSSLGHGPGSTPRKLLPR